MAERYRIQVDPHVCVGSGVCTGMAREYFEYSKDDKVSKPVAEIVTADEIVLEAAECCPMEAIAVTDAESGEVLAP